MKKQDKYIEEIRMDFGQELIMMDIYNSIILY